jgi:hypothetical protein
VQSEIGKQLCSVNGIKLFDSLDFYNYPAFNNEIQPVSTVKLYTFVNDWERFLLFDSQTSFPKLENHADLICRFEEAWTNNTVHLDSCSDDLLGNPIQCLCFIH